MEIPAKILVIGNSGVGKTSLCNRYNNDIFIKNYKPTVGGKLFYSVLKNLLIQFNWKFLYITWFKKKNIQESSIFFLKKF